jgi:hypothetical protein
MKAQSSEMKNMADANLFETEPCHQVSAQSLPVCCWIEKQQKSLFKTKAKAEKLV